MIGRLHHLAVDCPDPRSLAGFWSAVLGWPITYESDGWVVVSVNDHTSGMAFQLAADHRPPVWRDPARPQQMHLDVMVEDPAAAGEQVMALGGAPAGGRRLCRPSRSSLLLDHPAALGPADRLGGLPLSGGAYCPAGGAMSCCAGSWSWRTRPTGQVMPFGPWLQ